MGRDRRKGEEEGEVRGRTRERVGRDRRKGEEEGK